MEPGVSRQPLFSRKAPDVPITPGQIPEGALFDQIAQNRAAEHAQQDAAFRGLEAKQADPEDTGFGERLRTWIATARDWETTATNQLRSQLRRAVPDATDQEEAAPQASPWRGCPRKPSAAV